MTVDAEAQLAPLILSDLLLLSVLAMVANTATRLASLVRAVLLLVRLLEEHLRRVAVTVPPMLEGPIIKRGGGSYYVAWLRVMLGQSNDTLFLKRVE